MAGHIQHTQLGEVTVTRSAFDERLKGKCVDDWDELVALIDGGSEGGKRLEVGLTLVFIIIATAAVLTTMIQVGISNSPPRTKKYIIFAIFLAYGLCIHLYCLHLYADVNLRVVTNLLFGLVPFSVSCASYILALITSDVSEVSELYDNIFFHKEVSRRGIFFLAVVPGVATSIYLVNIVSTSFTGAGTFFDVLSFCLYVDINRLIFHLSFLIAPEWTLGSEVYVRVTGDDADARETNTAPDESASFGSLLGKPFGWTYVQFGVCLVWNILLARLEAGGGVPGSLFAPDPGKIYVLAVLNSIVLFVTGIHLSFRAAHKLRQACPEEYVLQSCFWFLAAWMMLTAIFFNAELPNWLGMGTIVALVFHRAKQCSADMHGFIFALALSAGAALIAIFLAVHFAEPLRSVMYTIVLLGQG